MSKRNVGEIIKRGRIYYIRYYDVKGRRRLETTKSTDKNAAEKQFRKRLSAKDAGVSPDAAVGKLTLKEATDDVLNDYKANFHGRHRNDPQGPACRARTAEGRWHDLPVRLPPERRTDYDLPHRMEECLQSSRMSRQTDTRHAPVCGENL